MLHHLNKEYYSEFSLNSFAKWIQFSDVKHKLYFPCFTRMKIMLFKFKTQSEALLHSKIWPTQSVIVVVTVESSDKNEQKLHFSTFKFVKHGIDFCMKHIRLGTAELLDEQSSQNGNHPSQVIGNSQHQQKHHVVKEQTVKIITRGLL